MSTTSATASLRDMPAATRSDTSAASPSSSRPDGRTRCRPADDHRDLPTHSVRGPRRELGQRAAPDLLVRLGQLAADRGLTIRPERLRHRQQRRPPAGAAPRRTPACAARPRAADSARLRSPALRGRNPSKQNRSTGSPDSASATRTADGPGTHGDPDAGGDGRRNQAIAGVGHRGHPGVGDQQDAGAAREVLDQGRRPGVLVALEVGDDPTGHLEPEVARQPTQPAGVLGGDDVGRRELVGEPG